MEYGTVFACKVMASDLFDREGTSGDVEVLLVTPAVGEHEFGFDSSEKGKRLFCELAKGLFALDCEKAGVSQLEPTPEKGKFDTFFEKTGPVKWSRFVSFASSSISEDAKNLVCEAIKEESAFQYLVSLASALAEAGIVIDWSQSTDAILMGPSMNDWISKISTASESVGLKFKLVDNLDQMPVY